MKLHEALEKCKDNPRLRIYNVHKQTEYFYPFTLENISVKKFSPMDLLDENWEVNTPAVNLTREKIAQVWDDVLYPNISRLDSSAQESIFDLFCKGLGL